MRDFLILIFVMALLAIAIIGTVRDGIERKTYLCKDGQVYSYSSC